MPRVSKYQPHQVSSEVVGQPRVDPNAGVNAIRAGGAVVGGVVDIAEAALNIKQRIDTTAAEEALVQFERDKNELFFNPESGYFNTQGRDAYDGAPGTNSVLDDLKKRYSDPLGVNARVMFDRAADAHLTKSKADIGRHASKGLDAWEVATAQAQIENTIENASLYWNQPDNLRVQSAIGRQSVLDTAQREGVGPKATAERLQTYESSFAKAAVIAATMSSAAEGQDLFDTHSDKLEGPDRVKLENAITVKRDAEKTQADAQQAVISGARIADMYDDRESIRDEVNSIEDAELRKLTMAEAMRQFNLKKQGESEAQADAFERAESHVFEGGSAETFKAADPQGWTRLSASQRKSIQSAKIVATDWAAYSDVMTLPKSELSKINPVDYFDKLAPAERQKVIAAVKSAKGTGSSRDRIDHQVGRTRTSQASLAVEQLIGKKSSWNETGREKANTFYSLLDEEVAFRESQKDGPLTSEEFTATLADLTRKVTVEKTLFGFDYLAPDSDQIVTDIPEEDLRVLSKFLRDNGIPVTADNIMKAQQQASR